MLTGFGGLDAVEIGEVVAPQVSAETLLVEVAAAALGPWDVQTADGLFVSAGGMADFPQILGWDFAGTVTAVGSEASGMAEGQRVLGFSPQPWTRIGAFASTIAVPSALVAPLPDEVDFAEGAALPVSGLTARLVLVIGANGAVGGLVLQLGRARDVEMVASVAARDGTAVEALGASRVVDRAGDVAAQVRAAYPEGVDVCIDLAGPKARDDALAAVRDGGRFVTTSPAALPEPGRGITAQAVGVQPDAEALAALARSCADGELISRVAEVVPFDGAVEALRSLGHTSAAGKIVLDLTQR
jgi:NADPH2:quinone reductase